MSDASARGFAYHRRATGLREERMTVQPADQGYWAGIRRMLLVVLLWSTAGIGVRSIEAAGAFEINAWRCLVAAACLGVVLRLRHGPRWRAAFRAVPWQAYLLVALFYNLGTPLYMLALSETSVAKASALSATSPIFTLLFSALLTRDRSGRGVWFAAIAGCAGVSIMLFDELRLSGRLNPGDLAALGVAITFSGEMVALRRWHHLEMLPAAVVANLVAVPVCLAIAGEAVATPRDAVILALMGAIGLALPFFMIMQGLKRVPAIQLVLISLLDILVSPTWVWLAVGEVPRWSTVLGALVIIGSVVLATVSGAKAQPAPATP